MLTDFMDVLKEKLNQFSLNLGENVNQGSSLKKQKNAKASLELDVVSMGSILPYESIDDELIFHNKNSMGFGLELLPATGADETMVASMAELLANKLPEGVDCSVMMFKHNRIQPSLKMGLAPLKEKGGIFAELADLSLNYHLKASKSGYPNQRNIAAILSDYRVYLFFSMPKKTDAVDKLLALRQNISSELNVSGFAYINLQQKDFCRLMQALLHPSLKASDWDAVEENMLTSVGQKLTKNNTLYHIHDLFLNLDLSDEQGFPSQTKIINCQIDKWPNEIALWQTPDFFANLLKPEHGLGCSFLISMTVRGVSQEKMMARAKTRAKSLNSNANAIQTFLNPNMKDEASDWNFVYEESSKGNLSLLPCFYNLVLFADVDKEREVVAKAISAYRQFGFELRQARATQWLRYLASLPFFMTEGFFKDFETLGMIKTLTHYNIANLMPIVADTKGSQQGLLLPTHRHQMCFLDTFDNKNLPITNFNFLTVGSSGAGKSMFQQAQILSGLAMGEMTYVIDLGASYKHLCELVGGTYIDVSNISLNPFTLFDFEGKTAIEGSAEEVADYIQIRDLLAIMASPHEPVSDVQKSYLLDAAIKAWKRKGRKACMDDVLAALSESQEENIDNFDQRLKDLIILLSKYSQTGIYGKLFNGDTPFVNQSNFVVFEMGGFQSNPDLLMIVMFVMIVIIQGQFYQSPRHIKKRCIIDEAWRFLCEGSNPIAANFIEQGFRTARKHRGGFGVLTQYLLDTEKTIQGQAIAASSDIKIIMRQGNFRDYLSAHPSRFTPMQQKMIENFGDVQGSGFSNLMIEAGNTYSFHRYFADPFTRILFSSSGEEFSLIEEKIKQGMSLAEAVKNVAKIVDGED